jgi:xanthine dehydrogenase accessory factor
MVSPIVSEEAVMFTPGGGRLGTLLNGAFDGLLADVAARQLSTGRFIEHQVTELESAICGLPEGSEVSFLVVPAAQFPAHAWQLLLDREAVGISADIDSGEVTEIRVDSMETATGVVEEMLIAGRPVAQREDDGVLVVLAPVTRLLVAGAGPIAQAIARQGELLGWKCALESRPEMVAGVCATLSPLDAVVVLGHDVEASSRCLMSALESDSGYIGALGSANMQRSRADWLAYRDVTDLSRVHGPAGLNIGAQGPEEIAVSVSAEIISVLRLTTF